MHGGRNKYDGFNNLIEMILKICEIALFTRATPGSSLVQHIFAKPKLPLFSYCNKESKEKAFLLAALIGSLLELRSKSR